MSDENYYAPVVCHWVCTNAACSEYEVLKDGFLLTLPPGIVPFCGVCGQTVVQRALPAGDPA